MAGIYQVGDRYYGFSVQQNFYCGNIPLVEEVRFHIRKVGEIKMIVNLVVAMRKHLIITHPSYIYVLVSKIILFIHLFIIYILFSVWELNSGP
jgi:hypothetical protein